MPELKPGWRRVRFGDVVRLVRETCKDPLGQGIDRYIGLEHIEPGDLRVRSWGDIGDGTTFTSRVRAGQVLFGKRRAYQRKVAVADFDAVCSGDIYAFESADPKTLLPDLLPFLCRSDAFFEHAVGTSAGSLSPRTSWSSLSDYKFALPPIDQQRRVAQQLRATRTVMDALADAATTAQALDQALLKETFSAELRAAPAVRLADVSERITDGTHQPPGFTNSGVPFLLVGNVSGGRVDWPGVDRWVSESTYASLTRGFRPRRGDVLYTLVGFTLGVPVLVDWDDPFVFQRHIGVIRPDSRRLDPRFLKHFLRSPAAEQQDRKLEEGGRQKTISLTSLREYRLPLPPLARQTLLANRLDGIEQQREVLTARRDAATSVAAALSLEAPE